MAEQDSKSKCQKLLYQYSEGDGKATLNGGYEDSLFLETPPESLTCPVCLLVLKEPHLLSCCGEHICKVCIEQIKSRSKPCPCCRNEDYTTMLNKRMRGNVHSLKIHCVNNRECSWTGELRDMEHHITNVCIYTEVECKYGCGTMVARHALQTHEQQNCIKCPVEVRIEGLTCKLDKELSKLGEKYESEVTVIKQTLAEQKSLIEEMKVQHIEETKLLKTELSRLSSEVYNVKKSIEKMTVSESTNGAKKEITKPDNLQKGVGSKATTTTKISVTRTHPLNTPEWYTPTTSQSTNVPPCVFLMDNFTRFKEESDVWYSQPFYSSDIGYKFCISLHANGDNTGKGSHISLYVILMKGDHDSALKWPFKGEFTLQLLNWKEDKNHVTCVIKFDEYTPKEWSRRLYDVERAVNGRGKHRFLTHSNLSYNSMKNTEYLNEDRLCFKVTKANLY